MKKVLSILLAVAMMCAVLAGCGGSDQPTNPGSSTPVDPGKNEGVINFDEDPYEVSIQFVGLFEANNDIEAVEAALNEITLKKINCTVDIVPVFIGDMVTKTTMGVAGKEKLDVVTVGLIHSVSSAVADEVILPLDDLLAERGQAALAVTANVAEAQKINGKTYGITGYNYAAMAGGFVYNKTMADEYGINMHDGMTAEELTAAAATLKEHGVYFTSYGNSAELNYKFLYGGDHFGSNAAYGSILDPNSTTIENVFASKQIADYFKFVKNLYDNDYVPADQMTDTTRIQELFAQGKIFGTATAYTASQIASWVSPNFETGMVMISQPTVATSNVQEYMLAIAANCKRPDKAMDLINLIYEDAEVANLLQYGVEGLDYVFVDGSDKVITREGTGNADGNGYSAPFVHFGDQSKLYALSPLTEEYYAEAEALEKSAVKSACFGYVFNAEDWGTEAGAISNILQEKLPLLNAGQVADVDAALADLNAALEKAGINDIIADNQAQLDAYLGK